MFLCAFWIVLIQYLNLVIVNIFNVYHDHVSNGNEIVISSQNLSSRVAKKTTVHVFAPRDFSCRTFSFQYYLINFQISKAIYDLIAYFFKISCRCTIINKVCCWLFIYTFHNHQNYESIFLFPCYPVILFSSSGYMFVMWSMSVTWGSYWQLIWLFGDATIYIDIISPLIIDMENIDVRYFVWPANINKINKHIVLISCKDMHMPLSITSVLMLLSH